MCVCTRYSVLMRCCGVACSTVYYQYTLCTWNHDDLPFGGNVLYIRFSHYPLSLLTWWTLPMRNSFLALIKFRRFCHKLLSFNWQWKQQSVGAEHRSSHRSPHRSRKSRSQAVQRSNTSLGIVSRVASAPVSSSLTWHPRWGALIWAIFGGSSTCHLEPVLNTGMLEIRTKIRTKFFKRNCSIFNWSQLEISDFNHAGKRKAHISRAI